MSGGAAFILIYICFVILAGLPVMLAEFIVGRRGQSSARGAFQKLAPGTHWGIVGVLGVICCLCSLSMGPLSNWKILGKTILFLIRFVAPAALLAIAIFQIHE